MRIIRILLLAAAPLVLAGCSSDAGSATAPLVPIEQTTFASALSVDLASSTRTADGLYYRDLVPGTGATLSVGQLVEVYYTGWLVDGTQFDARQTGTGFTFTLGNGQVITGWDRGLVGMKVGGTRQLVIPPGLAYGSAGRGSIPGNAVLVFTVRALTVR